MVHGCIERVVGGKLRACMYLVQNSLHDSVSLCCCNSLSCVAIKVGESEMKLNSKLFKCSPIVYVTFGKNFTIVYVTAVICLYTNNVNATCNKYGLQSCS